MEKVSIREKRDVPEAGGGGTAREVKEIIVLKKVLERGRWMKQSVAGWRGGASRVGKGLGADGFHLCPLHRLDHTQQANFCPRPTPPTDGGSQETCSGGRMNLAHTLNKSPRVSQDVTLTESREKLGTPFLPCPLPPPPQCPAPKQRLREVQSTGCQVCCQNCLRNFSDEDVRERFRKENAFRLHKPTR